MDIFQKIMTFISPPTVGAGPQKQSTIVKYIRETKFDTQLALIKLVSMGMVKRGDELDDPLWALTTDGRQGMGSLTLEMAIGPPPVETELVRVVDPEADVPVSYVERPVTKSDTNVSKDVTSSKAVKEFSEWRDMRKVYLDAIKVSDKVSERRNKSKGNAEKPADKPDSQANQAKPKYKPKTGK